MNTCADVRPLIDLAPLGLLDDDERATLYAHLPACAGCRAESTDLTAAHAAERRALADEAAPLSPWLREGLVLEAGGGLVAPVRPEVELPKLAPATPEPATPEPAKPDLAELEAAPVFTPVPLHDDLPVAPRSLPLRRERRRRAPWILGGTAALALASAGVLVHQLRQRALHEDFVRLELRRFETGLRTFIEDAEALVRAGAADLERGDLADAHQRAAVALTKLDELPQWFVALMEREFPDEARAAADEELGAAVARERELRAAALVLRARATMRGDERDALTHAQEDLRVVLEQVRPNDLEAMRAQGELLQHQGKLSEALEQYRHVLERAPDDVAALLERARVLSMLESHVDVIPLVTIALELPARAVADGQRQALLLERARACMELADWDRATQDVRAARALSAGPAVALCEGELLMRRGDHLAARDVFAAATVARASALLEAGFHAEALSDARVAVERDPASRLALVVKAEAEEANLLFDEALRDAEVVTLRVPPREWALHARAQRVLARVRATAGNLKQAHEHARRAHQLDESSSAGRLLLAGIELDPIFEDQYLDDAESLFKQVLRQRPRSLEARRGLGLVTLAKHARTPERAQRKLEDAYELDSRDPWTMSALARVLEARSQQEKARALRSRAARFERDARRPEGFYYLLGAREERRAREVQGTRQTEHLERARDAYRRAVFLDPLHAQALAGLAAITHFQGARAATEGHLKRALAAHPGSTQALVLAAAHLSARDQRDRDPVRALAAVSTALARRGETLELLGLRALLTPREALDASAGETVATKVELALARFADLRRRDPWSLANGRLERELIASARQLASDDPALRSKLDRRDDELRLELSALAADVDVRDRSAVALLAEAGRLLAADAQGAVEAARIPATRDAPWRADCWAALARGRARTGDVWAALAAGVRAAFIDDRHAPALFELLRAASRASEGDLAQLEERVVALDRLVLPFELDLERLLRAAPHVARALVARPEVEEGKRLAEELLELTSHDPTSAVPQVLLGVLAHGADQDELALQALLAVATLREDAGEAYYLAALTVAGQRDAGQADLVRAVEWLQAATRAGFDWQAQPPSKRLDALRQSPLWARVLR